MCFLMVANIYGTLSVDTAGIGFLMENITILDEACFSSSSAAHAVDLPLQKELW